MPYNSSFFPGSMPVLPGNGLVTLDLALQNPEVIRDAIEAIPVDYSFASLFFAGGDEVAGGSVIYEQYLNPDHRFTDRDVQPIEPGAEFPEVGLSRPDILPAKVTKWGGQRPIPYETIKRNAVAEVRDTLTVLANTIARKTSAVCLGALNAAPIQTAAAAAAWNVASDPIADINTAISMIRRQEIDDEYGIGEIVAAIHPTNLLYLGNNSSARSLLPREGGIALLSAGTLEPIRALGVTWVPTNRQTAGTIHFGLAGKAGRINPERQLDQTTSGMYVRVVDQPLSESQVVMAARIFVPTVSHPRSVYRLTGVGT